MRSQKTAAAPASASVSTMTRPMPCAAPVTMATLPSKFSIIDSLYTDDTDFTNFTDFCFSVLSALSVQSVYRNDLAHERWLRGEEALGFAPSGIAFVIA